MDTYPVLIVSQSPLFIEALARLVQTAGARVIGRAPNIPSALTLLEGHQTPAIIVDSTDSQQTEQEIISQLTAQVEQYRIVFLSSASNHMSLYRKDNIVYTTPDNLLRSLCVPD